MNKSRVVLFFLIVVISSCSRLPIWYVSYANEPYTDGFGLYGYALMNNPGKDTSIKNKNLNFVNAFYDRLPYYREFKHEKRRNLTVTYWLVTTRGKNNGDFIIEANKEEKIDSPSTMLKYYDYNRAFKMLTSLDKLNKPGPFLVAWKSPYEHLTSNAADYTLFLDLSNYDTNDMNTAILLWRKMMSNPDSRIENGVLKFLEDSRQLLQKYGGSISSAVNKK